MGQHNTKPQHVWKRLQFGSAWWKIRYHSKKVLQFFVNIKRGLLCFRSMFLSEAPTLCCKKCKIVLLQCVSLWISSKRASQIFDSVFQTWDVIIFVHRGVIFVAPLQTHHVYYTLKRLGNGRFHVVSTWNTGGVFVERSIFK